MLLGTPLAIWFGLLTIIFLLMTFSLGLARTRFKKNVFRQHKMCAHLTVTLATIHLIFAVLLWFFGIMI